ncbi:transglutaminase-like domain-containing protein [Pendulispora brunnea]|uniref:Transglutaminase-like domain-containing protein n=1 Tax=Pendulispora brunnea TaxID=2905690 RepID=A0ABZ2K1F4_9BACT
MKHWLRAGSAALVGSFLAACSAHRAPPQPPAVTAATRAETPPPAPTTGADSGLDLELLRRLDAIWKRAGDAYDNKRYDEGPAALREIFTMDLPPKLRGMKSAAQYQIACFEALAGKKAAALDALRAAADIGYDDIQSLETDDDLTSVRSEARFSAIREAVRTNARRHRVYDVVKFDNADNDFARLHEFENIDAKDFVELRTRYKLESVVAGERTQLGKQLALLAWVHNRWSHSGLVEPTHEDALTILREVEAGKHFRCVEYSVTLAQVFQTMGYPARTLGLTRDGASFGLGKGHAVTEVWNDDLGKWYVADGQNNGTWRLGDVPLSAAEIRDVRRGSAPEKLRFVLGRSSWMEEKPEPKQRAEWEKYFEHLTYNLDNVQPPGNDKHRRRVALLGPREHHELLFQGSTIPERVQASTVAKIYPAMNRVHIDVGASAERPGVLTLHFDAGGPWLAGYRIDDNGRAGETKDATWTWTLRPGKNQLRVSMVNTRGVVGRASALEVDYFPPE